MIIAGHATSISLEAGFWDELRRIAAERGQSLNQIITEIDENRAASPEIINLSSAIRLFVLEDLRQQITALQAAASPSEDPA